MKKFTRTLFIMGLLTQALPAKSDLIKASPPVRSSLEIYDIGYAWITELRRVAIPAGEHDLVFEDLPGSIVPGTSTMLSSGRTPDLEIREQRYQFSLENVDRLVDAFRGQRVEVSRSGDRFTGRVLHAEARDGAETLDVLLLEGDQPRWVRGTQSIKLLDADESWAPEPRLVWTVDSRVQQADALRLTYQAGKMDWSATYTLITDPDGGMASLSGKAGLDNHTSRTFSEARITLVRTELGQTGALFDQSRKDASQRLRYSQSNEDLQFEQQNPGAGRRHPLSAGRPGEP